LLLATSGGHAQLQKGRKREFEPTHAIIVLLTLSEPSQGGTGRAARSDGEAEAHFLYAGRRFQG